MAVLPPSIPYQAAGTTFVTSRKITIATTYETPIAVFSATTKELCWNVRNCFCLSNNQSLVLNAYADPTIKPTGGTPQTPINIRIGSPIVSSANVLNDPQTSAFGAYIASMMAPASAPLTSNLLILIDPGHSLLVTAVASQAGLIGNVGFSWYELDTTHVS